MGIFRHRSCDLLLTFVTVITGFAANPTFGVTPRITVAEDLSDVGDMKSCVMAAADAASAENLDGFLSHFAKGTQRSLRRKTAMLFARYDFGLDVVDCHVIDCTENKGELALRYLVRLSESQVEVVAVLNMRREDGYWKISREKVTSMQSYGAVCSPSRSSYLGGQHVAMR